MFVADFQNYIAPITNQNKPTNIEQEKKTSTPFHLPNRQISFLSSYTAAMQPPEYIYSRNYFANKERFSNTPKEYLKPLRAFQRQQKQKELPNAYKVPLTTLLDVTKPKPPLMSRFTPNEALDSTYTSLQKEFIKKRTAQLYIQNDTYFKRAYAA